LFAKNNKFRQRLYNFTTKISIGSKPQTYLDTVHSVESVHVVSKHVATDKLTTANSGTFTSSSANLSSQSR